LKINFKSIATLLTLATLSSATLSYEIGDSYLATKAIADKNDGSDTGLMKKGGIQSAGGGTSVSLNVAKYYLGGEAGKSNGVPFYIIATPTAETRLSKESIQASLANNDLGVLNFKFSEALKQEEFESDSTWVTLSSATGLRMIESIDPDSQSNGTERIGALYLNAAIDSSTVIYGDDGISPTGALTFTLKLSANHFQSVDNLEKVLGEELEQTSASLAFGVAFEIEEVIDASIIGNIANSDSEVGNGLIVSIATSF